MTRDASAGPDQRGPDRPAARPQDAPVGGQAVVEGVMMRGVRTWALAVRRPHPEQLVDGVLPAGEPALGDIAVAVHPFSSALTRHRLLRLPVLRGVVALGEALRIGFRALRMAADAQSADDAPEIGRGSWLLAGLGGLAIAVGLFFLAPVGLTSLLQDVLGEGLLFWLVEGVVRTAIFLAYLALVTRMADMRRVFEYHGAEHQTIACYEAGLELTPENASRFSRLHPRCGTSFLLIAMIVAIFVFAPVGTPALPWLLASRVVGIPLVVGVAFELLKLAGRYRHVPLVAALTWPGLQLQRLTTRTPDRDQLQVAIAALATVLDREDPRAASARERVGAEVAA